jgi:pimeloyl-ACP methyl ester carboxylesterase/DNA-binding CsgD family transcriptional regulator
MPIAARAPPLPLNPVVPRFGVAIAWLSGGKVVTANPLWQALGALHDPPLPPDAAVSFRPFIFARHRLPVWTALARPAASQTWPQFESLPRPPGATARALAYVPSRTPDFPALAARVFGLAEAERQTLHQLLASHDIAELAQRLELSPAGARKRVAALYRAIGVSGLVGLQAQTTRMLTDEFVSDQQVEAGLRAVLGLTPAQALVARLVSEGHDLPAIGTRLGLSPHTVRDHARAAMELAGVPRLKDLAQVVGEAGAVHAIALGSDGLHHDRGGLLDATRILRRGTRQIGLADYGPPGAVPIIICHGGMGMRRVGPELAAAFQAQGFRPIGIDRPGFGLSDAATADHFETAADDMAHALATLGLQRVIIAALDGGAPAALAFWQRHGDRMTMGALVAPRPPASRRSGNRVVDRFARISMVRPDIINGLWRILRHRAGSALAGRLTDRLFSGHPVDAALLQQPEFRAGMVAELLTCGIRSGAGIIAEQSAYRQWQPRAGGPQRPWLILIPDGDPLWVPSLAETRRVWDVLGQPVWQLLADAGRFAITSHAGQIAALVADHWHRHQVRGNDGDCNPHQSGLQSAHEAAPRHQIVRVSWLCGPQPAAIPCHRRGRVPRRQLGRRGA